MHSIYVKKLLWKLVAGPLSEMNRIKQLMASIENNILSDFEWAKHATDKQLITKYKKTRAFRRSPIKDKLFVKKYFCKMQIRAITM